MTLSFLKGAFLLLPVLGVAVPYGLPLWLCLTAFIGAGLLTFGEGQKISLPPPLILTATGLFLLWMGVSTFWAPNFFQSLKLVASLTILFCAGILLFSLLSALKQKDLRTLKPFLFTGFVGIFLFLALDISLQGSLRHALKTGEYIPLKGGAGLLPYNQGGTFLAVLFWPFLGLLYRSKRGLAGGFLILVPVLLLNLESHAAVGSMGVGALVFLGVYALRKPALLVGGVLVFLGMIASPHLVVTFLDPVKIEASLPDLAKASYSHRLWIWRYVAHRAFERPLLGWGLDASRDRELKQSMLWHSERFGLEEGLKSNPEDCANESIPLHPHNMALQVWLELGVIGSILASTLLALFPILLTYLPVSRFGKSLAAATYASALVVGFVAYGVWQNWWMATLLINLAITGWMLKTERKE